MKLHVHEWGARDAPPVVCLHGITAHGGRFRHLAEERLADRFHVLALDLRGHGRSSWEPPWSLATHIDDVLETLDAAGTESAAWIGHSFGARLILELAGREPSRIERAALLDPAIRIRPDNALRLAEGERREQRFATAEDARPPASAARVLRAAAERLEADRGDHLEQLEDGSWRWRYCQSAVVAILGELASWPPPPEEIDFPTLIVVGADESVVGERQLDRYRRALGDKLEVVTVPGGHVVLWDAYDETAEAVARFLGAT
jgi:lipase